MSELMTSLGNFMGGAGGKGLNSVLSLAGTGANAYSGIQNAQNTANYNSTQSYIQDLVKNPTKMAAAASQFQQPLSVGLTDAVTNQAQAQLAERGLGGSPAAMTSAITQALAPYIQNNQQTAMQTLMNSLNLGSGTRPAALPTVNLTSLLKQLNLGGGTGSTNPYQSIYDAQQGAPASVATTNPTFNAGIYDNSDAVEADTGVPMSLFADQTQAA